MNTISRNANNAIATIQGMIQKLYHTFLKYKAKNQEHAKLKKELEIHESSNHEYRTIVNDKRENIRMFGLVLLCVVSMFIDFFTIFEACKIMVEIVGWPRWIAFIFPFLLIILEIGISYYQIDAQRKGHSVSWVVRNAQYLIVILICGLIIMTLIYAIGSYSAETSSMSFGQYLWGTIALEVSLGIVSILLHLWIIRVSEDIIEAISYCYYLAKYKRLTRKITRYDKQEKMQGMPRFSGEVQKLIQRIDLFKRENPNLSFDFTTTMPEELLTAIKQVMGKRSIEASLLTSQPVSYEPVER